MHRFGSAWLAWRPWPLEKVVIWTIVCILLFSANCHPWYLTWFIPLLAIYPHPSLLLWISLAPLAYAVRIRWDSTWGVGWVHSRPVVDVRAGVRVDGVGIFAMASKKGYCPGVYSRWMRYGIARHHRPSDSKAEGEDRRRPKDW
jgi:hypothetical protein